MNRQMGAEIVAALDEIDNDASVRVVILTGAGRAFCAGADLSIGADAFSPIPNQSDSTQSPRDWGGMLVLRIFYLDKPIIAAINGAAVGIGATMTLPCDLRLASSDAKFGFVFTRRGIITDGCASWFLPRIVGIGTSLKWCLTGAIIPAEEAAEAKLVETIHKPEELYSAAQKIARDIAANTSAVSVALTRRLLWRGLVEDHPMASHRLESTLIGITSASADAREGVESFFAKRAAEFPSRVPNDLPPGWPFWSEPTFTDDGSSV